MSAIRKYLAEIGRRGGRRSRRTLDAETARNMVRVREARRAFRRFHALCFPSHPAGLAIALVDVPWVAEQLMALGDEAARQAAARLVRTPESRAMSRAATRRHARNRWPVRVYRLGEEPSDNLSAMTTPEERLQMVTDLSRRAWELSGQPFPERPRALLPITVRHRP